MIHEDAGETSNVVAGSGVEWRMALVAARVTSEDIGIAMIHEDAGETSNVVAGSEVECGPACNSQAGDMFQRQDGTKQGHSTQLRLGVWIELFTISWMTIEAAIAIITGYATHSVSLQGFGIDSIIELIAGAVLLWRLLIEQRGGAVEVVESAERRAAWITALSLFGLAIYIVGDSAFALLTHSSTASILVGHRSRASRRDHHAALVAGQAAYCKTHR